jgi:hypothetical protein
MKKSHRAESDEYAQYFNTGFLLRPKTTLLKVLYAKMQGIVTMQNALVWSNIWSFSAVQRR